MICDGSGIDRCSLGSGAGDVGCNESRAATAESLTRSTPSHCAFEALFRQSVRTLRRTLRAHPFMLMSSTPAQSRSRTTASCPPSVEHVRLRCSPSLFGTTMKRIKAKTAGYCLTGRPLTQRNDPKCYENTLGTQRLPEGVPSQSRLVARASADQGRSGRCRLLPSNHSSR